MVVVAQLVRASVCGTEGRGFEPHLPPKKLLQKVITAQKAVIFFFVPFYSFGST